MITINDIKKSIDTDFSEILNQYDALLEKSGDLEFVLKDDLVKEEVQKLIELIRNKDIKRIPYASITTRVIDFNSKTDSTDGLSESFDFLIDQMNSALSSIINELLNEKTFSGKTVTPGHVQPYNNSIVAFYKLLEHTKLANSQYQNLYQKTENEVGKLNLDLDESKRKLESIENDVQNQSEKSIKILKEASNELDEVKKTRTSIYTDFIAILGVFSSFVFVMFGGFSALSSIIESVGRANISMTKVIFISSVLIGFLITVLYSLVYWISLIIGKQLVYKTCDCEGVCKNLKHLFIKHRYYLSIIGVCLLFSIISAYLIINKH